MNKIFNINLGGYPFTIDDNAYQKLTKYLTTIEKHFSASEGCDEIISDIESRIAELFNESLNGQPIVSLKDIDAAIVTMGTPEEFGAVGSDYDDTEEALSDQGEYKTGKKLFRDPDTKIIGGVCSGLSAYFGIEDPLWVRLGAVALMFTGGLSVPLYILLLIILPKARTSADKLAMRGERIDINNIAKTIEDEFDNISDTFSDLDQKIRSKKKDKTKGSSFFLVGALAAFFSLFGRAFFFALKVVKKIFRPLIALALIFLGAGFAVTWIGMVFMGVFMSPFVSFFSPGPSVMGYGGLVSGMFSIGIPIFAVLYFISKFFGRYRVQSHIKNRVWSVWGVSSLLFIGSIINYSLQWQKHTSITSTQPLTELTKGTITLKMDTKKYDDESMVIFDQVAINKNDLQCDDIRIKITETDDEVPSLVKTICSNGPRKSTAFKRINEVSVEELTIENNTIKIPRYFTLTEGSKYRGQALTYEFKIPKGYEVEKDRSVARYVTTRSSHLAGF